MLKPIVVDFETEAIEDRPAYPPKPVGVALWEPGKKPYYLAWGHPTENNCSASEAKRRLQMIYREGRPLLFHNAKFDLEVAHAHLGLPIPPWDAFHDTLFLLFLDNPHATSLSLKPAAEAYLGMVPEERDAVRDWLVQNKVVAAAATRQWGAHIAKAPGKLVGEYAVGDVVRTGRLFDLLYKKVQEAGMLPAYDRERKLLPILLANEREGMRVDVKALRKDLKAYEQASDKVDGWIRKVLKAPELNIDSDRELADALEKSGVVTEFVLTEKGQKSVSKKNLTPDMFNDEKVARALGYRSRLATCMSTFIRPWLALAEANDGRIFTTWNQVRQSHGYENTGTRTGRMSCSPNFQNIPKTWDDKGDGYVHPVHLDVPPLPTMRRYILPDVGHQFGHRDYNQQELRILAHFEGDKLCSAYQADPWMDVHDFVKEQIQAITNLALERRAVKVLNFGMIYGMGLGKLAVGVKTDVDTARRLRNAQRSAIPGLAALERDIKERGAGGLAVRTWGKRLYYVEPPKEIDGELRTFEYKLLNYLIQGSAADCTKEAIIRYHDVRKDGRFLVTVHDECNISAEDGAMKGELKRLREAMESVEFDVPMLTDAKVGKTWGALKPHKEAR